MQAFIKLLQCILNPLPLLLPLPFPPFIVFPSIPSWEERTTWRLNLLWTERMGEGPQPGRKGGGMRRVERKWVSENDILDRPRPTYSNNMPPPTYIFRLMVCPYPSPQTERELGTGTKCSHQSSLRIQEYCYCWKTYSYSPSCGFSYHRASRGCVNSMIGHESDQGGGLPRSGPGSIGLEKEDSKKKLNRVSDFWEENFKCGS